MRYLFVDAENISITEIKKYRNSHKDRVLVFTKNPTHIFQCNKLKYISMSEYPNGSQQADFFIVATLSRLIALNGGDKTYSYAILSNDFTLCTGFEHICKIYSVESKVLIDPKQKKRKDSKLKPTSWIGEKIKNILGDGKCHKDALKEVRCKNIDPHRFTQEWNKLLLNGEIKIKDPMQKGPNKTYIRSE